MSVLRSSVTSDPAQTLAYAAQVTKGALRASLVRSGAPVADVDRILTSHDAAQVAAFVRAHATGDVQARLQHMLATPVDLSATGAHRAVALVQAKDMFKMDPDQPILAPKVDRAKSPDASRKGMTADYQTAINSVVGGDDTRWDPTTQPVVYKGNVAVKDKAGWGPEVENYLVLGMSPEKLLTAYRAVAPRSDVAESASDKASRIAGVVAAMTPDERALYDGTLCQVVTKKLVLRNEKGADGKPKTEEVTADRYGAAKALFERLPADMRQALVANPHLTAQQKATLLTGIAACYHVESRLGVNTQFDPTTGHPLNPTMAKSGTTGIKGLAFYFNMYANFAADPIVKLRLPADFSDQAKAGKDVIIMITRGDRANLVYALPGGMVEPGHTFSETLEHELAEESMDVHGAAAADASAITSLCSEVFDKKHTQMVYQGPVDDDRATDHAFPWTTAVCATVTDPDLVRRVLKSLRAGDDASSFTLMTHDEFSAARSRGQIFASHGDWIDVAFSLRR